MQETFKSSLASIEELLEKRPKAGGGHDHTIIGYKFKSMIL